MLMSLSRFKRLLDVRDRDAVGGQVICLVCGNTSDRRNWDDLRLLLDFIVNL